MSLICYSGWIQDGTAFHWRTLAIFWKRTESGANLGSSDVRGAELSESPAGSIDWTTLLRWRTFPMAGPARGLTPLRTRVFAWSPPLKTSFLSCPTWRKPVDRTALAPAG